MKILMKSEKTKKWNETTLENFNSAVEITRDIIIEMNITDRNAEEYEKGYALGLLKSGRIIDTPVMLFKLGEDRDTNKCPKCDNLYIGMGALSRRDNKTNICPDCGMREAIEDIQKFNK